MSRFISVGSLSPPTQEPLLVCHRPVIYSRMFPTTQNPIVVLYLSTLQSQKLRLLSDDSMLPPLKMRRLVSWCLMMMSVFLPMHLLLRAHRAHPRGRLAAHRRRCCVKTFCYLVNRCLLCGLTRTYPFVAWMSLVVSRSFGF